MNRIQLTVMVACFMFLAYILGQVVSVYELPTSKTVREALLAVDAIQAGMDDFGGEATKPEINSKSIIHNDEKISDGLTLVIETGGRNLIHSSIDLVAHDGEVRHSWSVPWEDIVDVGWPETAGGGVPMSRNTVYPRATHMYPNGDLLLIMHARGRTPFGASMVKLDADSNLIWAYNRWAHHDISVAEDGRIYTLGHELKTETTPSIDALKNLDYEIQAEVPFIDDTIDILSAEGEQLASVSLLDALANSEFVPLLGVAPPDSQGDLLHANSVQVVTESLAQQLPFAEPGNVLVSVRTLHALLLVDMEQEKVTWVATGQWRYQHDANFLDNGNVVFLDNIGDQTHTGGATRIVEFNPETGEEDWVYSGTAEFPLNTRELGELQKLPNGNVLISATLSGKVVEVTPDKEVVWEYHGMELIDAARIPFDQVPARFSE